MPRSSPRPCRSCPSSGPRWRAATSGTRCWSSARRSAPGCRFAIDNPHEVGADRLVNAVAAYDRVGDTCVVVDFGTAITYDVVSAAGEYLGGIITPGVEISIDALYEHAAKLPKVELAAARADRQVDGGVDPQRDRVRLRRSGRRDRPPAAGRAGASDDGDRHRRARGGARAVRPRDDRRGRRPADADRVAADLGAQRSREPASRRQVGAGRVSAPQRRRDRHLGRAGRGRGEDQQRRSGGGRRARCGVECSSWVSIRPRIAANTGASSISSGTSQASRASASISAPASPPRIVAIAPSSRNSETRSSSTCGGRSRSPSAGPAGCERLAGGDPQRLPGGDRADLLGAEADLQRRAQLKRRPTRGVAVRGVAGEQDLAGRHEREQRLHVGRHPPGGVEQQVRVVRRDAPDPRQVADAGVGEDQPRVREVLGELDRVQAERRDAAAGVDQHRQRALVGERDQLAHLGVVERELSARGCSLIPRAPAARHRSRLGDRVVVRVDAAERDEQPVESRAACEHHVVGGRIAVGLVHREHERATGVARSSSTSSSSLGVCFMPSGSFWPMCVCTSNSSTPGTCSSTIVRPGLDHGSMIHVRIRTMNQCRKL